MKRRVKEGQSLVDIALETCGAVEGTWALAVRNGLSVTAHLELGREIAYESEDMADARVADKYAAEGIEPATEVTEKTLRWLLNEEIEEAVPAFEEIKADKVTPQPTRASIFGTEFTTAHA